MSGTLTVNTLEELYQFLNEKGVMEIAIRGNHKRFKNFQKIAINNLKKPEAAEQLGKAMTLLNQNNQIATQSLQMLGNITKLSQLTMVLSGANLFATAAGFAIMNAKLNKMSDKIDEVIKMYKDAEDIHTTFEVNNVVSEHSNMLDCRKKQNNYSEEKMRKLVADEYNVLDMLMNIFSKDMSNNPEVVVFTMLSMASMLAVSMKYFDEVYYFNNKEAITSGDIWHLDHDKWMATYDKLAGTEFVEMIQDYGLFGLGLNTIENDCFYKNYKEQVISLKQDIVDNQTLIESIDDAELFMSVSSMTSESAKEEIEKALKEAGEDPKQYEDEIHAAVA